MSKKNTYEVYWEERIGYNFERQFNIYKFLCGRTRCKRKIVEKNQFRSYNQWKRSIQDTCSDLEEEELEEFYRYLNLCRRDEKVSEIFSVNFGLSLYVAILAGVYLPSLLTIDWGALGKILIECIALFSDVQSVIESIFVLLAFLILLLLVLGMLAIIILPFGAPLYHVIKDIFKTKLIEGFYMDYMDIVEEMKKVKS